MFTSSPRSPSRFLAAAALLCASLAGCGNDLQAVYPVALATANSQQGLALGPVEEINGTYGEDCVGRQGAWSVSLGQTGTLTNPPLSVQQDNSACVLTLESIRISAEQAPSALYQASPPLALQGGSYAATPSRFSATGMGPAAFYANATILPDSSFQSSFVIQVIYSDDPAAISVSQLAQSAVAIQGAVSIQDASTPDYSVSLGLTIQTNLLHVVTAVSGGITLTAGSQPGESFAVLPADLGTHPSYGTVDAAFVEANRGTLSGTSSVLPWNELFLLGQSLQAPIVRTIVISHTMAGVRAYQLIRVTFSE